MLGACSSGEHRSSPAGASRGTSDAATMHARGPDAASGSARSDAAQTGTAQDAGHGARAGDAAADAASRSRPEAGAPSDPNPNSRQAVDDTLSQHPVCQSIAPFYWEIGNAGGVVVSGSIGNGYARDTQMEIASASKWLYAGYYVQKSAGQLLEEEIPFLNFTSGYASITGACLGRSVSGCNRYTMNTAPGTTDHPGADDSAVGRFDYNSGHLEAHAERYGGLADATAATLPAAIVGQLGAEIQLSYVNPVLAGGVRTSSAQYAAFLQKLVRGELELSALLGTHTACTLSADYATLFNESCDAAGSPWWPASSGKQSDTADLTRVQNVHYSIGHWVESDGAFSSPGLFGFYPWVDREQAFYGLIARRQVGQVYDEAHPDTSAYAQSVQCGQAVRAAWFTGAAQH